VMEHGRIVERGPVYEVFSAPQAAATRRFVNAVVASVPEADDLALLAQKHPGRLVTLTVTDGETRQSEAFLELGRRGIGFELVYGGIDEVGGRSFGNLTLALTGDDDAIDEALAAIGSLLPVTEVTL
jgi:D-methionine transport system ATP-binding protein